MSDPRIELVANAIERDTLNAEMTEMLEQAVMCQHGHLKDALRFIEQNKIADAKHELEEGRLHMSMATPIMLKMKKRSMYLEEWIMKNGPGIVEEQIVESEVAAGAAKK